MRMPSRDECLCLAVSPVLDQTLFPGYKMTFTVGNKTRLSKIACANLFGGKYGCEPGQKPVVEFEHQSGKNTRTRGAWSKMWYKDMTVADRTAKSSLVKTFSESVMPGVPSKEELVKLTLEQLKLAKQLSSVSGCFPEMEQLEFYADFYADDVQRSWFLLDHLQVNAEYSEGLVL